MAEAREKLATLDSVAFADNLDAVESGSFDYVFCLEVFEHLPEKETVEAIAEIHRLLKHDGVAVIGVPHELFLPALLKGLFRMSRRYGDFDARPANVLGATLGRAPTQRPVAEISPGFQYHFHHLGFDYRKLEQNFQERFQLAGKWFSPFPVLGAALNSEVYLLFRNAQPVLPSPGNG
jgi:SAM-dependent methyltransferase